MRFIEDSNNRHEGQSEVDGRGADLGQWGDFLSDLSTEFTQCSSPATDSHLDPPNCTATSIKCDDKLGALLTDDVSYDSRRYSCTDRMNVDQWLQTVNPIGHGRTSQSVVISSDKSHTE